VSRSETKRKPAIVAIRVFPVGAEGSPHYTDDFAAIPAGKSKRHGGVDIFAGEGTPVLAVDDGEVEFREDPIGGHAFYLHAVDRTVYYGAHLSAYEGAARSVLAGEVIGYVGQTGNAAHTSPHLHFEAHPAGGIGVDPFRELASLEPAHAGDVHPAPRPAPPPGADLGDLAVVLGPVPPIPHLGAAVDNLRRRRPGPVALLFGLGLAVGVARAARRAHR
jgi:murein DD-endopeptidase MepM/ murein hydrolase activator NlpD